MLLKIICTYNSVRPKGDHTVYVLKIKNVKKQEVGHHHNHDHNYTQKV